MSGGMQWVVKPKLFKPSQDEFLHRCVPYRPVSGIGALTRSYTTKSATAFTLVVQRSLVYIYTNSRLLRHRRGPNPVQWYGIHQIHSDDESDGEAPDGDDPGGHPDIDANMADNDDIGGDAHGFDTIDSSDTASSGDGSHSGGGGGSREYNGVGSQFDGAGGSGGADLEVFDFCEGEDQPHATTPVPPVHDEPRDAPSIATFSIAEDL